MIVCAVLLVSLCFVNGFLLDPTNQQNSGGSNNIPYLTVSAFVDEKKQQQREFDRTLALLTSQLQQKFANLEKKINELEKDNDTFQTGNQWEQKYQELEKKYTKLQTNFETLKADNMLLKTEFSEVRNETVVLKAEITALQKLKNNYPLQDILTLQQNVQSVAAKTNSLSVNQQARNQDFLALYNETLISKQKIVDLQTHTNEHINKLRSYQNQTLNKMSHELDNKLSHLETQTDARINKLESYQNQTLNKMSHELDDKMSYLETQTDSRINKLESYQNQTLIKMNKEFEEKIEGLRKFQNMTTDTLNSRIYNFKKEEIKKLAALQDKITKNSERVALTGCVSSSTTRSSGYIIRFSDVNHHVGIQHLNDFRSSGKFTCEKEGLYQISTTITTYTSRAQYYIYINGVQVADRYMSFEGSGAHSSSAIVTMELNVSDKVWVQTGPNMYVYGKESCFTVIKVR